MLTERAVEIYLNGELVYKLDALDERPQAWQSAGGTYSIDSPVLHLGLNQRLVRKGQNVLALQVRGEAAAGRESDEYIAYRQLELRPGVQFGIGRGGGRATVSLLIGVDLGTSETKAGLFDQEGNLLRLARCGYPIITAGETGCAEQDPERWWSAVCQTLREVAQDAPAGELAALCVQGQGPSVVMADERGQATEQRHPVDGHPALWRAG